MVTTCSTSQLLMAVPRFMLRHYLPRNCFICHHHIWFVVLLLLRGILGFVLPGRTALAQPSRHKHVFTRQTCKYCKTNRARAWHSSPDHPPARKTHKMGLFCVWLERQGIESAFPLPPQNSIAHSPRAPRFYHWKLFSVLISMEQTWVYNTLVEQKL